MGDKRVALVVGGTGGIGSSIVRAFIKEGVRVCATYHNDKDASVKMVSELGEENLMVCRMDVCDGPSVRDAFGRIAGLHKEIDIVVFSATPPTDNKGIFSREWDDFQRHIDVQVKGLFNITKALMPQIKRRQAVKFIVVLTQYCIGRPPAGLSDYVSAKYGLMGLSRSMASELARYGCTVNMVSPGMTDTELIAGLPAKLVEAAAYNNPLKRIARPEDVAGAVLFLASDGAGYVNGANITVNGGEVMQ